MVPQKSDPRWKKIVTGQISAELTALPTKMLMMRLQLLTRDGDAAKINEAIEIAHNFFSTNHQTVQEDVNRLFGAKSTNQEG